MTGQAPPLLVGEFVDVSVDGGTIDRYLVLPRSALKADNSVWVVRNGAVDIVTVRVLQQADEEVFVVADGISSGDELVVSDMSVVTPGMKVRVTSDSRTPMNEDTSVRDVESTGSMAMAQVAGLTPLSQPTPSSN
jgi:multidrug efflux pump subunit AcrA (membrane-fusion protein)